MSGTGLFVTCVRLRIQAACGCGAAVLTAMKCLSDTSYSLRLCLQVNPLAALLFAPTQVSSQHLSA